MNLGMVLSSAALGISLVVSAFRLVDWLVHSEPRTLARVARWSLFAAAAASGPILITLLLYRQWTIAMAFGAAMLAAPAVINWRLFIPRRRFRPMWGESSPLDEMRGDVGQPPPDPELVRRAAIVLEDYLIHARTSRRSARESTAGGARLRKRASRFGATDRRLSRRRWRSWGSRREPRRRRFAPPTAG